MREECEPAVPTLDFGGGSGGCFRDAGTDSMRFDVRLRRQAATPACRNRNLDSDQDCRARRDGLDGALEQIQCRYHTSYTKQLSFFTKTASFYVPPAELRIDTTILPSAGTALSSRLAILHHHYLYQLSHNFSTISMSLQCRHGH
jgi:hypothetical protein